MVESWILSRRCWICSEESPQSPFLGKAPMKMSGRRGGKTNKLISRSPHRSNVPQLSIVAQLFHRGESNCIFSYSICCPPPHSAGYPIAESYDRKDFQRGAQNPDLPFGEAVYFFCATLSRAIVHPEPVVAVLHRVIIRTMSIFCHIFYGFKIDGKADWRAGQVLNLCKFDDISEWKALKISHSSKSWISKWNFFFVHRRCIPTAESIVSLCSLGSNDQLTLLQQVTGPWEKAALFSHYFHFPQMRPSEI